jgi:dipeptidyl-peptidase-4
MQLWFRPFFACAAVLPLVVQALSLAAATSQIEPLRMPVETLLTAADAHLGTSIGRLVDDLDVEAAFVDADRAVLYRKGPLGRRGIWVTDTRTGSARLLINDAALVAKLRGKGAPPAVGRVKLVDFSSASNTLTVAVGGRQWLVGLDDGEVRPKQGAANRGNASPDGKWNILAQDYNLLLVNRANGRRTPLTQDGTYDRRYGVNYPRFGEMVTATSGEPRMPVFVRWSPDSSQILTYQLERNDSVIHTASQLKPPDGGPPRQFRYVYPNAGAEQVPQLRPILIDVSSGKATMLDVPPLPLMSPGNPVLRWQGNRIHYLWKKRGFGEITLFEIDPKTNRASALVREVLKPAVLDSHTIIRAAPQIPGMLLVSERSGWAQLYLVRPGNDPAEGQRLTSGEWEVASIEHIGSDGQILITGNGREEGVNPYFTMLYRVGQNGKLINLTPEPLHHDITVSANGEHFIDRMSSPVAPVRTLLRSTRDGRILVELAHANPAKLVETGFVDAEVFRTMAADGKTPLYAIIHRPRHFDPSRSYPVVEHVYTGPTTSRFRPDYRSNISGIPASLAQLGAVVVTIDGRGTSGRGRAFRLPAWQNLWSVGIEDHVHVLQRIKAKHPCLNLDKVGIAGHSAGGFDAFRFMIQRPDIYKVGVSSAGNHDMRLCKVWWPEQSMGLADEETWLRNTGKTYADKLQGKLLLIHGDIDENVPLATTQQLSEALNAANKTHEFKIIHNRGHDLAGTEFNGMMRDFFLRHLIGTRQVQPLDAPDGPGARRLQSH